MAIDHEAKIILVHVVEDIDFNAPFTLASTPVIQAYHKEMENQVKKELASVISPEVAHQIEVAKNGCHRQTICGDRSHRPG